MASNPNTTPHSRLVPVHTHQVEITETFYNVQALQTQAITLQTQVNNIVTQITEILDGQTGLVGPPGPQGPPGTVPAAIDIIDQFGNSQGDVRQLPTAVQDDQVTTVIRQLQLMDHLLKLLIWNCGGDVEGD